MMNITIMIISLMLGVFIGKGIAEVIKGVHDDKPCPCVKIDDSVTVCAKDILLRYPQLEEVEGWQNKTELRF
jgi:hypothetical protein